MVYRTYGSRIVLLSTLVCHSCVGVVSLSGVFIAQSGERPADPAVGRNLMDLISTVPKIDPEEFDNMLNSNMKVRFYCHISSGITSPPPAYYLICILFTFAGSVDGDIFIQFNPNSAARRGKALHDINHTSL